MLRQQCGALHVAPASGPQALTAPSPPPPRSRATGGPATASWQRRQHETRADKHPEEVGRTTIKHPEPGEEADATSKEGLRSEEQPRPVVRRRQAALPARLGHCSRTAQEVTA